MTSCNLCLIKSEDPIAIGSDEGQQWNIAILLQKYFRFCYSDDLSSGFICHNCWSYVQTFHEFYVRIEETHQNKFFIDDQPKIIQNGTTDIDSIELKNENSIDEVDSNFSPFKPELQDSFENSADDNFSTESDAASTERKCKICQVTIPSGMNAAKHFRNKHGLCIEKNCKKSFNCQNSFDEHILKSHSKSRCIHCNEFFSCDQLKKHVKGSHSTTNVCHLCGKAYKSTNSLLYHCRMEHIGLKKLQCDICKEWLKSRQTLKQHMLKHIRRNVACNICGKVLAHRVSLQKHKIMHNEELQKKHKCVICLKGFRDKYRLKEHSSVHSGIGNDRKCEFCDKTFRFSSSFSAHRRKEHAFELEELARAEREVQIAPLTNEG